MSQCTKPFLTLLTATSLIATGLSQGKPDAFWTRAGVFFHVNDVAASPDGAYVAYADQSGVKVLRASDHHLVKTFHHPDTGRSVEFTPDGRHLLYAVYITGTVTAIYVVQVEDWSVVRVIHPDTFLGDLAISPDGRYVCAGRLFRIADGSEILVKNPGSGLYTQALGTFFSSDSQYLYGNGFAPNYLGKFRLSDGLRVASYDVGGIGWPVGPPGAESADGRRLVSSDGRGTMALDTWTHSPLFIAPMARTLKWSNAGDLLYTSRTGGLTQIRDGWTGAVNQDFVGHWGVGIPVVAAFAEEESVVLSGAYRLLKSYRNTPHAAEVLTTHAHAQFIGPVPVAFSADGARLMTGVGSPSGPGQGVSIWDAETGESLGRVPGAGNPVALAFSANGQEAIVVTSSRIEVWNIASASLVRLMPTEGPVASAAVHPASGRIAVHVVDSVTFVYDVGTLDLIGTVPIQTTPSFSEDGAVIVGGWQSLIRTFDARHPRLVMISEVSTFVPGIGAVTPNQIALSRDRTTLAFTVGTRLFLRNVASGDTRVITGFWVDVRAMAFSADGETILCSDRSNRLQVFSVDSGERLRYWDEELLTMAPAIQVSPSGDRVAITRTDATLMVISTEPRTVMPAPQPDSYVVQEDGILNSSADEGVLANDLPEGMTATLRTGPTRGTLEFQPDGSFVYQPYADANGEDSFTYIAHVGDASSDPVLVRLTVEPVNDPPTVDAGPDVALEATAPSTPVVLVAQTFDADGDSLTYAWKVEGNPVGSGQTLSHGFGVGTYRVTVEVSDGNGGSATDEVVVAIRDTTAPALHGVPETIVVSATSAGGAVVSYPLPTATDLADPNVEVVVSHAPGTLFALGETVVQVTATDASGNWAHASFLVKVTVEFGGFLPPIQPGKTHKAGSTIPVKFRLAGSSAGIGHLPAVLFVDGAAIGSFGYDPTTDTYHANWNTRGYAAGPHRVEVDLGDGTLHSVIVVLR